MKIEGNWGALIGVGAALVLALGVAGAASSAYKAERSALAQSHFANAERLHSANKDAEAVEEYRTALFFSPDSERYRLALATQLLERKRLDEAETYLQQLENSDPTNPMIYLDRAHLDLARNQIEPAIHAYQHAVYQYWPPELVPLRRKARWELANLLAKTGRRNEAIGELLLLYAGGTPDKERVASALLSNGAPAEAIRIFSEVLRQDPRDESAHVGMAQAQFATGRYVSARHYYQSALRLDPHDQQAQAGLQLTNETIDVDPNLSGISERERLRRSDNLLKRVLAETAGCATTPPTSANDDPALAKMESARAVWMNAKAQCGAQLPKDEIADRLLTGAQE